MHYRSCYTNTSPVLERVSSVGQARKGKDELPANGVSRVLRSLLLLPRVVVVVVVIVVMPFSLLLFVVVLVVLMVAVVVM